MTTLAVYEREPVSPAAPPADHSPSATTSVIFLRSVPVPKRPLTDKAPQALPVPGIAREILIKLASESDEWEQAYRLVGANYRAKGYEPSYALPVRFTAYHALPDTVTLVAKHKGEVIATQTLVADNTLRGLPLESIYAPEIAELRRQGRRMGETIGLADTGLSTREFLQVFTSLIRLTMQYHVAQGGNTWVITVNPRHRNFYTKVMGFIPFGTLREYPTVQDAPAEAFLLDLNLMRANAPKMHQQVFGEALPRQALVSPKMSPSVVRYFGGQSSHTDLPTVNETLSFVDLFGSPRRW